jgi:hypothetical protein
MLGNNFKTILKEERWSKLPTFTVLNNTIPLRRYGTVPYKNNAPSFYHKETLHKKRMFILCTVGTIMFTYEVDRFIPNISYANFQTNKV